MASWRFVQLGNMNSKTYQMLSKCIHTSNCQYRQKTLPILTLYTKDNCSLCDDAKEILKKHDGRFVLKEVYIDKPENKKEFSLYRYDIPVFHFNGKYLMKHFVDEELLGKTLQQAESKPT